MYFLCFLHLVRRNGREVVEKYRSGEISLEEGNAKIQEAREKPLAQQGAPIGNINALKEAREKPIVARSGDENKGNNITFVRGTSSQYLLRRLSRDYPELLDKLESGESKSVRQAGKYQCEKG